MPISAIRSTGSRAVARRIVGTFLLCALLPLFAFAWHAHRTVTAELEETADKQFRNDVVASAVTLLERLRLSAREFETRVRAQNGADPDDLEIAPTNGLVTAVASENGGPDVPVLTAEERALLTTRDVILIVRGDEENRRDEGGNAADVWLVTDEGRDEGPLLFADLDETRLFDPSGLRRQPADLFIATPDGQLLHGSGPTPPRDMIRNERLRQGAAGALVFVDENDEERLGRFFEATMAPQLGLDLIVGCTDLRSGVVAPAGAFRKNLLHIALLTFAAVALFSLVKVRGILDPVRRMIAMTRRISDEDFSARLDFKGNDEFGMLGRAFDAMAADLEHGADVLRRINAFGSSLSTVRDPERLLDELVRGASTLFSADGAALHMIDEQGRLRRARVHVESTNLWIEGDQDETAPAPREGGERLDEAGARAIVMKSLTTLSERRAYALHGATPVAMRDHEGELIGVLSIFNPRQGRDFGVDTVRLAQSLTAQASLAISNNRLVHEFKNLFDSFIELIASAIDEKSPYTGGHCRRVPVLAMMIADAARKERNGPFAEFGLTDDQYYEMEVASMLHDCGKVVTPVHVVDKATKLETIHDRIHLVDARYEVLKRDAEIALLRRALGQARDGAEVALDALELEVERDRRELEDERDFLRRCNVGDEAMPLADQDRVRDIAGRRTWRDPAGREMPLLDADEIENLTIKRGTLTAAERKIINDHIVVTIRMLERLPFPKNLKNVTAIAGAHHERMDGKGFPKGLVRDEIPIQGRILALADVFEALTASDRPYKPGKSVSEALDILGEMARGGHVDQELFDLFVERRVWEAYAREHLAPEQIDVGLSDPESSGTRPLVGAR